MIRRVGRPGLVGTMARTAVVAGTATAVSGGMVRHANKKEMERQQDEYYQQQMMQQQYGGGITQPSGNGTYLDPSVGRRTLF